MSRPKLSYLPVVVLPLFAACGGEEPLTPASPAPVERGEPISSSADCDPDDIVVGAGGPRVSRTAPVTVRHGEAPDDLVVWVEGPEGKHAGETFPRDGKTVFLPVQPYPADAELTWNVRMCGEVHSGTFHTGSLLRPVADEVFDAQIAGQAYALDLRVGSWSASLAELSPKGEIAERLVFALGGALLVDVIDRDHGAIRVAVAAAHPDNAGGYTRASDAPAQVLELPWGDNPYATIALDALALETSSGEVTLRDALVGVGFDDDGVAEAFVSARLEVSEGACALLSEVGVACEPCSATDDEGTCFPVSIDDLYGIAL